MTISLGIIFPVAVYIFNKYELSQQQIRNVKFVAVKTFGVDSKETSSINCRSVLCRFTEDSTKYIVWKFDSDSSYFNCHMGDTLRFKFINKKRIFAIHRTK